ncbi:MAG: pyrimidine-nucleoside phosphorylase [Firmicutes bacterium]|nr:pyrimidine-nucleoside phosphorylase [Bacillota bacterium]
MLAVDIIRKKRDGAELTSRELEFLIEGYVSNSIPDYQLAAFLMAVYFQGLNDEETAALTLLMAHSGELLDLKEIKGVKVDKHSTGGVGDTTTLIVAPLVASCGVPVAKMSGRGLGHTGGTVDKLESIPGYRVELSPEQFVSQVNKIGVSIVGQTAELAPADKLFYALRDVTGTVDSIPLIASSIMSKKIAAGADCFVLDVKAGRGAFMKSVEEAVQLAQTMVEIGSRAGKETVALVTDMNQPLGRCIGNALEVKEAILTLSGKGPQNLTSLCLELSAEMLVLAKAAENREKALQILRSKLQNKQALSKFGELIKAQGGNPQVLDNLSLLPQARCQEAVLSTQAGYIQEVNPLALGQAAVLLGAGRRTKDTVIDLAVGIELKKQIGEKIQAGEEIARAYANDAALLRQAVPHIKGSFTIAEEQPSSPPLVYRKITANNV